MDRRQVLLLSSLVVLPSLAGCIEELTGSGTEPATETEPEFEAHLDSSSDCALQHEVELLQPHPNHPDGPVTLEVTVENTTDDELYYYPDGNAVLYQVSWGRFNLLHDDPSSYEYNDDAGAWELTEPVPHIGQGAAEIGPDESIDNTYVVLPIDGGAEPVPEMITFETWFLTSSGPLDTEEAKADADECEVTLELSVSEQ